VPNRLRPALLVIILTVSSLLTLVPNLSHAQGYRGRDFWLAFPRNARSELSGLGRITLWIAAEARANGTIEFMNGRDPIPVSIQAGAASSFAIDTALEIVSTGRPDSLSVHITLDRDASVYVVMHRIGSTDSYMAIPTAALGSEYLVAGYAPMIVKGATFSTEAVVVATENNTLVSIQLSDSIASFSDSTALYPAGRTVMHVLQRGQTLRYSSDRWNGAGDLTGSRITATKPIAVVTGHVCAQVPSDRNFCDMLLEMVPPASQLGTDFYVPAFAWKRTYVIRVIASMDSTVLTIGDSVAATLRHGQSWESGMMTDDLTVHTSHPALVAQYATGSQADSPPLADPFMLFVTPNDRFVTEATAVTLMPGQWNHFVTIVTEKDAAREIRIDGQPVSDSALSGKVQLLPSTITQLGDIVPSTEPPHRTLRGALDYMHVNSSATHLSVIRCELSSGRHLITSTRGFAAYEYGFGHGAAAFDSYGNTCGAEQHR
jgi:hypothetical protein